jgi:DNA-directed RNA polymerase subunit N (RpoN/RPB10)
MVLADKYRYFQTEVRKAKMSQGLQVDRVIYYTKDMAQKDIQTPEANVLNSLGLTNVCCRRIMLTHVDIE